MQKTLLFVLFSLFVFNGHTQEANPLNDRFLKLQLPGKPDPERLLETNYLESGLHQLTLIKCHDAVNGNQHCRYQISVFNIPVKGFHLTAHYDLRYQQTDYIIPKLIPKQDNHQLQGASISLTSALEIAKNKIPATTYKKLQPSMNGTEAGLIYVPTDYNFNQPTWTLAYEIDIYTAQPVRSERLTIDANTGKIIATENRICSFATGTAETKYHGTKTVETTATLAGFVLHDQTRGSGITTTNLNNNDLFYDGDNYWNNTNPAMDEVAGDVHWGSGATFDFYKNTFNHHGLDGNGLGINSFVHLNDSRAYWDGSDAFYGDGLAESFFDLPFTYINIIAHEMTHGVTQYASDLIYSGESGGLNESISDIMGVCVENHTNPGSVDWLFGEEISSEGEYFRNMADPNSKGMADTYNGNHWSPSNGVHQNSSIGNYWFYLLASGGSGTNDNGFEYAIEGVGWEKATKIAYQTWSQYLSPSSGYNDCAIFSIEAAKNLYGDCSEEVMEVQHAWAAVGINLYETIYQIFATDNFFCDIPAGVTFSNNSQSQNILWDFGDGNQSTETSPTHYYNENGTYTVSFSIIDCLNDNLVTIKEDFITVDEQSTTCDTILLTDWLSGYETGCTGWLLDDGGEENYANRVNSSIEIESPFTLGYRINFDFFETAPGDKLSVYAFDGNAFYLIDSFDEIQTGNFLDIPGGKIKLKWHTSWSGSESGFVVSWECLRSDLPVANFTVKDSISCDGIHHLLDKSSGVPTSWTWFLNDSIVSTEKNPTLTVPPGTYDISLIACNDLGCDTSMMTNLITHNPDREICHVINMTHNLIEIAEWCTGTVFDDGGSEGNFSYSYSTVDIVIPESKGYIVDFISFYTRYNYDELKIFVDNGNGFELYETYSGFLAPFTIQIPGEKIRFRWKAEGIGNYPGFEINWTCLSSEVPITNFANTPNIACSNLIKLIDNSFCFPNQWTWLLDGDSVSNEQHPIIDLGQPGTYDLGLISCNNFGCDTLHIPDYLVYDNTLEECLNIKLNNKDELFSNACVAQFTDNGGQNSFYSNNVNASLEIAAPGQMGYLLNFYSFYTKTEDTLFLYTAQDNEFEHYDTYSGNLGNFTDTIEASELKFVWKTSPNNTFYGFLVTWDCMEATIPTAQFYKNSSIECDSIISINNNSQGDPTSWIWIIDDAIVSTIAQPEFLVSPGTYDVTLIACNATGCDTTTSIDYITYDPELPFCKAIRMENGLDQLVDLCEGTVYSNLSSYTGDSLYSTLDIASPDARGYKLDFTRLYINNSDTLKIFVDDGNGFESVTALTGYHTNATLDLEGTRIRFIWKTASTSLAYGFEINWKCHTTEIPIANFSDTNDYVCSSSFQLKDNSQNFPNRWIWLIDGDSISNQQFPIIELGQPSTYYDLGLIACNDNGCDTLNILDYLFYEPDSYYGCSNFMLPKNTEQFTDACSGYFYNRRWERNLSSEGNTSTLEIDASETSAYLVEFQFFNLLENDSLFLYQDLGNGFELYTVYNGNNSGNVVTIEGTRIKFVWKSENLYPGNAFYIAWSCLPTVPLQANFTRTNFNTCTENIQLINQSTGFPSSSTWLLNNEIISQDAAPPSITVAPGNYDVTLIICKQTACDTMYQPDFITYNPDSSVCQTVIMKDGLNQVSELCAGTIVHNNDIIQSNNITAILTIETPGATGYEIDLITFNTTYGGLKFEVDSGNGFEFHSYLSGIFLPQTFTVAGSKIRFTYNNSQNFFRPDFEIKWQCYTATKPVADFSSTPEISCSHLIQLRDRSTNFPEQWTWFLNDSIVSNEQYPVVDLGAPDTYDLGLIVCNTYGCDTLQVPNYLTSNPSDSSCLEINFVNNVQLFSDACDGQFFDNGGPDGKYLNNSNSSLEIAPPDDQIGFFLNFNYLDLRFTDSLKLYVDRGNGFEYERYYSFLISSVSQIIYGKRLKFVLETGPYPTREGFDISWNCIPNTPPIIAFDFATIDDCLGHYQLNDQSSALTNSWTWLLNNELIDTIPNPMVSIATPGNYDVTLIACNDIGCDTNTVENLITYDPSTPICSYFVMNDSLNLTTENCEGIFMDDGGNNENYSHNVTAGLKISAPDAQAYKVNFNFFETETFFDFLTIYADNGFGFEPVESYAGEHTGHELYITAPRILFEWTSDNSGSRPGFEISWTCTAEPVIAPTAEMVGCENTFDFAVNSSNTDQVTWHFGDGNWEIAAEPTHHYAIPGSYQVNGSANNEFGDTTFTMFIVADYYPVYFNAPDNVPVNEYQQISILEPAADKIQQITWKLDGFYLDDNYSFSFLFDENRTYEVAVEITDLRGCVTTHSQTIVAGTVGTQDLAIANILIQPNPTRDLVHISNLQQITAGYSLNLYNIMGQQVYQNTPDSGVDHTTIDLSGLPTGVYYLNIENTEKRYRGERIIKIQ